MKDGYEDISLNVDALPVFLLLLNSSLRSRHNSGAGGSRRQFVFVSLFVCVFVFVFVIVSPFVIAVVIVFEDEDFYPMETQCWGSGFHAPLTHSRVKEADNVERKTCPGLRGICM